MLWAAFTLAFFGFLRSSEFTCNDRVFDPTTHLCVKDVTFIPTTESRNYMIKRSKTDHFCNGSILALARSTTSICAVMAMKDYVLQCQPPPVASGSPAPLLLKNCMLSSNYMTYHLYIISHIAFVLVPRLLQLLQGFLLG